MKKFMYLKNLTPKQERAKERITDIERQMRRCKDDETLFDLYCECCDIWDYNFQMEELMNPDPNFRPMHEEIFIARQKDLENKEATIGRVIVSVNNSSNVNINITINGKEMK